MILSKKTQQGIKIQEAPIKEGGTNNTYQRPNLGKCLRGGQQGHLSNECPQRRAITIVDEDEQDFGENEVYDEDEVAFLEPNEGDQLSCILQRILLTPKTKIHPQRYALF